MPKSTKIFYYCLSFIVGLAVASFIFVDFLILGLTFLVVFILLGFLKFKNKRIILLIVFFLFLGVFYYQVFLIIKIPKINLEKFSEFKVQVIDEPDKRVESLKLKVESLDFKINLLLTTNLFPKYDYGDILLVKGKFQKPEEFNGFAYDKYLARQNIYYVSYYPQIKILKKDQGNFFLKNVFKFKNLLIFKINKLLPEPQSAFLAGLLIGARKSIEPNLLEAFNRTGVTHIIAISGFNITIIVVLISNLAKHFYLDRKKTFWLIFLIIFLFVILTGAAASIVRAGIMGLLVLLAKKEGRFSHTKNILILSAVLMLLFNPKILVFDVGFQLSFLATIGLVYLSPALEKYFQWLPKKFGLQENFLATLSATLITLPLILYQFGRLSTVAILTNILILQVIPWAMFFGFLSVILSLIWLSLGKIFGLITWLILSYIIIIVEFFSQFNWAVYDFDFNIIWLIIGYFVIFIFMFRKNKVTRKALTKTRK